MKANLKYQKKRQEKETIEKMGKNWFSRKQKR
jgi:hypothetical protein